MMLVGKSEPPAVAGGPEVLGRNGINKVQARPLPQAVLTQSSVFC
jgi:hypothetical protein